MESHGFARQPFSLERRRLLALDCRHVLHFESSMLLLLTVEAKALLEAVKGVPDHGGVPPIHGTNLNHP